MVDLQEIKRIYLYGDGVSFRSGITGLSNLILTHFDETQVDNCLFVFFNKNKRQLKALQFDETGIWLYQKKSYNKNFVFPQVCREGKIIIDKEQLITIINSLEITSKKRQ